MNSLVADKHGVLKLLIKWIDNIDIRTRRFTFNGLKKFGVFCSYGSFEQFAISSRTNTIKVFKFYRRELGIAAPLSTLYLKEFAWNDSATHFWDSVQGPQFSNSACDNMLCAQWHGKVVEYIMSLLGHGRVVMHRQLLTFQHVRFYHTLSLHKVRFLNLLVL